MHLDLINGNQCINDQEVIPCALHSFSWGGEDVDIFDRITQVMPLVIRPKESGYMHVRDSSVKKLNPSYYKKRNLFPRQLPPSSLSVILDNPILNERLLQFIRKEVLELRGLRLDFQHISRTYGKDAKIMTYQIILSNSDLEKEYIVFIKSHLSPVL